jgi:NADH:ubiquinone reductase (H+-translocating)
MLRSGRPLLASLSGLYTSPARLAPSQIEATRLLLLRNGFRQYANGQSRAQLRIGGSSSPFRRPVLARHLPKWQANAIRFVETDPASQTPTTAATESAAQTKLGKHMTKELPSPSRPFVRFLFRGFFYIGIFVGGIGLFIIGFFLYDASTYGETPIIEPIHMSSLALNPRLGGPKNLPVIEHFIDDDDSDHKKMAKHQPKLVILGTGWGSVALLKSLKPEEYHITVISPSNQFLFTPMLPSATVGTLELRSLVEPVRKIVNNAHGHFLKALAVDVCFEERLVEVEAIDSSGGKTAFYIPYDKLVIACGMLDFDRQVTC